MKLVQWEKAAENCVQSVGTPAFGAYQQNVTRILPEAQSYEYLYISNDIPLALRRRYRDVVVLMMSLAQAQTQAQDRQEGDVGRCESEFYQLLNQHRGRSEDTHTKNESLNNVRKGAAELMSNVSLMKKQFLALPPPPQPLINRLEDLQEQIANFQYELKKEEQPIAAGGRSSLTSSSPRREESTWSPPFFSRVFTDKKKLESVSDEMFEL